MIKYSNYLILFTLLIIGVLFKNHIHISTNLLSLFASEETIEKFTVADNLGYSKELFVVVKGFDKAAKTKVKEISQKLHKVDNVLFVQSTITPSDEILQYYKEYYPVLADFNKTLQTTQSVRTSLQNLYDAQFDSIFYTAIDKNDPLKLFNLENKSKLDLSHKGQFITLGDYGYLIRVSTDVSPSNMGKAKLLYKDIHNILDSYENVKSFAPFYYTVENSTKIQEDVQWIVLLSTIVLLIIYYLLIKNIKLLSHTLIALFSSMVFATLVSTIFFTNFNALSLAFGMSISAVSIDYLLHYYFHNFYQNDKKIDKNVLYGFITTMVAFGIFSFIPIPIISQISFFAVMSLSFAYLLFTFVFPKLSIVKYVEDKNIQTSRKKLPAYLFFILSIFLFAYASKNITLDTNIRNLDYQNHKLQNLQKLFNTQNNAKLTPVIIQASSKEELLSNLHKVHKRLPDTFSLASFVLTKQECIQREEMFSHYDFQKLNELVNKEAKNIGFRDGYFTDSYDFMKNLPSCNIDNFEIFKRYGLAAFEDKDSFYSMAFISDFNATSDFNFVSSINAKEIFSKLANEMYENLLLYSSLVVLVILILLLLSVKGKFLYAFNYIAFPISLTLAILVSFAQINFMHIFSLIILIAIGIDYGIYMSNTNKPANTLLAINYSILSTLAAFGVLIFSSIVALHSIGIVISIGASAIFILTKVMK